MMSWKNVLRKSEEADDWNRRFHASGFDVDDTIASYQGYDDKPKYIISDGEEYIDLEYDYDDQKWHDSDSEFEEDSKLGKWFKATGPLIDEDDLEDDLEWASRLGFEVGRWD